MSAKFELIKNDLVDRQELEMYLQATDFKEDVFKMRVNKVAQKLNPFVVDQRYALRLDEII